MSKSDELEVSQLAISGVLTSIDSIETQTKKLKYQLQHLEKSVENTSKQAGLNDQTTQAKLSAAFSIAQLSAFPSRGFIVADVQSCDAKFGDYQCNSAMPLCQWLKKNEGKKLPPVEIAKLIISHLPDVGIIGSTSISPQGFINATLSADYVADRLKSLLKNKFPAPQIGEKVQKVVVDMSSPNVAKEMHVGHLRSTIIGESVSRLLSYCGHKVLKLNHIGDWGTQFGMLIAHLQDKFPNFKAESPPIGDLQAFYKESKKRFDDDEEFKKRAYANVVKLQAHDEDIIKAWTLICNVSRTEFQKVYKRLGIEDLIERGESFYQNLMKNVAKDLAAVGVLEEDEGRKIFFAKGMPIPLTIIKSDGGFTYDTSDMAALRQRLVDENADRVVYVIDNGQRLHMECVFAASKQVGWLDEAKKRVDFVGFGVVLGEDKKKFKTRSGESVRLVDLLNEGLERSAQKLKEKGRNEVLSSEEFTAAQKAVAYGCIKYADLSHNRNNDYVFSFDRMLDDKGNTAVYMLYAYTRIRSIGRNAGVDVGADLNDASKCDKLLSQLSLKHEKEVKLAKMLLRFQEIVLQTLDDLLIHKLCEYLYELATAFTEFYDNCYCVEKDRNTGEILKINTGRLLLCEATAVVMERCFYVLGIEPVEKM